MCLPHLHPFWVNQKKKKERERENCWKEICYPFKSKNGKSQLHTNPEDCTDESHGWAERAASGIENRTSEQKSLRQKVLTLHPKQFLGIR
jgi:hypothetical protein